MNKANRSLDVPLTRPESCRRRAGPLAINHRLPTIASQIVTTDSDGLMSYRPRTTELSFRAATCLDKIDKGAKLGDLPVEQPTKFELVINLRTAKQIGVTIPPNVLARADKVIK
jgi:putative ABC transport system substrate-binding protein